jgi:uncharacterized protein (TIGR00106 family)
MAIMEIRIIPLGLGHPSVGDHIAEVERYLRQQKLPYQLTDMGTLVQGDATPLLELAQALHNLPFARGVKRVVTHITIDDRRDKEVRLGDKTSAVQARLA